MATLFIDLENGNDNYGGTSFNLLVSGTDGRITSSTFSAATANFINNGTLCNTKNLLAYAENLDNDVYFSTARTTRALSNITPPSSVSGSAVWNILETIDNNTHDVRTVSTAVNLTLGLNYTTSCYVKANGRNQIVIRQGNNATKGVLYNLSTGIVAASGASATGSITNEGNGWYRISLTTTPDTANDIIYIMLAQDSYTLTTAESYIGDITKGFYFAAPQLEQSNSVTSYEIPVSQQYLSIFNGSTYSTYHILNVINSTTLGLLAIPVGNALSNQAVDRQYYIGGRWRTITNGATGVRTIIGDNIRIMSSPDPTLVGSATFTSSKADVSKTIASSTNTSPISITCNSHGYSTNDIVMIAGHTTNTNANGRWIITSTGINTFTLNGSTGNGIGGASGSVRKMNNCVVILNSAVTANVASYGNRGNGRSAWIANTNVVTALDTDTKEGDVSDSIAIAAGFTIGKAAYKATGTLNLGGYQQISFWIKQTAGTAAVVGDISLRLCSDTTGDVTVNTIAVPAMIVNSRWIPFTVNLNTNLGTSIQSIALYVDSDKGAQTFLISNIIACKASSSSDSLNLQSLIGKNTSSEKWWAGIQSINDTIVIFDQDPSIPSSLTAASASAIRGYIGISQTTPLFKRETIKTNLAIAFNTIVQSYTGDSGALSVDSKLLINLQFGYDRNNMSIQSGETFMDGLNSNGQGLSIINKYSISISNAGFVRYWQGLYMQGIIGITLNNLWFTGHSSHPIYFYSVHNSSALNIYTAFNIGVGLLSSVSCQKNIYNNIISISNNGWGMHHQYGSNNITINSLAANNTTGGYAIEHGLRNLHKNCIVQDNAGPGLYVSAAADDNIFLQCSTTNNTASASNFAQGTTYIKNCTLNETTESTGSLNFSNSRHIFINNDNSNNNYVIYTDNGIIYNTVAVRYSNSGFSWALSPTNNIYRNSLYPLDLSIAKIAVNANSMVTVRAWMRRTSIGLTTGLRIKGDQIAGVANDITSYMTAAADTWEQVTLSFTPTEAGVVEILAECWGGNTFTGYVDDITITQV